MSVRPPVRLALPFGVSALLHVAVVAALIAVQSGEGAVRPPVYRVTLVAAAPGPRAAGVVNPPRTAPAETPPPAQAQRPPTTTANRAPPARQPTRATPTPPRPATAADRQVAQAQVGGGEVGGRGTDVTNVRLDGIEFPFQAYLDNIVRQIALQFPRNWPRALVAEVTFLINRDGSVKFIHLAKRSGSFEFDDEATGAIEAVGRRRAFGPLPTGFADDVLPVTFSFDPKIYQ